MGVLARNVAAAALYSDFGQIPANRRNYVHLLFTDPASCPPRALRAQTVTSIHTADLSGPRANQEALCRARQ